MTDSKKKQLTRWGTLAISGVMIILILGGVLYAQGNFGGGRRGQNGQGDGMGMMGGPGGPGGPGPGMGGGPGAIVGAQFLMHDPEIIKLMGQIKVIDGINRIGLTEDQVEQFIDLARDAQKIMNDNFGNTRDEIKSALEDQLDGVLAGEEISKDAIRDIMESNRNPEEHQEIRDELEGILESAINILTDEQNERLREESQRFGPGGPGQPGMDGGQGMGGGRGFEGRGRNRGWGGNRGGGGNRDWGGDQGNGDNQNMRGNRMDRFREGAGKMVLMLLLLSPEAVDSMELWLDAR